MINLLSWEKIEALNNLETMFNDNRTTHTKKNRPKKRRKQIKKKRVPGNAF